MQVAIPAREDRLHAGQLAIVNAAARFNPVMCGRRFGKSTLGAQLADETALAGGPVGWFAPSYKYLDEPMRDIEDTLRPVIRDFNRTDKRMFLKTGGVIDFWSCDGEQPGRSRAYKRAIVDEAGFVPNLMTVWNNAIRPTLTDYRGDAWLFGTPHGRGDFSTLFARGENGTPEWKSHRARTIDNPFMDPEEVASAKRDMPAEAFAQEYEGVPAPDGGNPFDMTAIAECAGDIVPGVVEVWGIDLAKSHDWTVACGLNEAGSVARLDRWQGDWRSTRERLVALIGETAAFVDSTGVGDPIVEDLQARCPMVEGYKFTGPSKQQLMEGLALAIQRRSIRFPNGWLRAELDAFRYEYTASGVRYSGPPGMNDDGVCALALSVHGLRSSVRGLSLSVKVF